MMKQAPVGFMPATPKESSVARDAHDGELRYQDKVDTDLDRQRVRDRMEADLDRQRIRERLEATLAGLGELHYLRQRQELLVRGVLSAPAAASPPTSRGHTKGTAASQGELYLSPEEKLLEENILLLRKQLNCLRRRDAGLITQLQELDKQISDLRLDVEKASLEHLETESRPSSGFYELSDGASGSLSNSSNSVFSECLSSCHSSTCFCSPLDASLSVTDGRPKSADDLHNWVDCGEGQLEDQTSGTVHCSFSAPHSSSADMPGDVHPKYQCDLISKNGNDVYRYPSPLHAVAVQSPIFFQSTVGNNKKDEKLHFNGSDMLTGSELGSTKPEFSSLPQSSSWPASQPSSNKKLDNYIFSLIQKKTQPIRTNKPRTSLNTDAAKGIFRQGSICVRQTSGVSQGNNADLKPSRQVCLHSSETNTSDNGILSPVKQWSKESNNGDIESRLTEITTGYQQSTSNELQSNSLPKKMANMISQGPPPCLVSVAYQNGNGQHLGTLPKENACKHIETSEDNKVVRAVKYVSPKKRLRSPHIACSVEERPPIELRSEGSSSQSLDEGHLVNAQYIPAQQQSIRFHKGTKHVRIVKVKSSQKNRMHISSIPENNLQMVKDKAKISSKKCRFSEDLDTNKKAMKKLSSRGKKSLNPQLENVLPNRQPGLIKSVTKHNVHGREFFLAKPKHKRDYRRWKTIAEISYEEALRRARRRHRREMFGACTQAPVPYRSPYAYVGSDSEYSAECESLFHSTVVDTSEDEHSNYTTNCFGDSESSLSEADFVEESTTSSDSEESGGLVWPQFGQPLTVQSVGVSELHNASPKTFVKIKASHNLKKKILRFRSGSLKLMTTV